MLEIQTISLDAKGANPSQAREYVEKTRALEKVNPKWSDFAISDRVVANAREIFLENTTPDGHFRERIGEMLGSAVANQPADILFQMQLPPKGAARYEGVVRDFEEVLTSIRVKR